METDLNGKKPVCQECKSPLTIKSKCFVCENCKTVEPKNPYIECREVRDRLRDSLTFMFDYLMKLNGMRHGDYLDSLEQKQLLAKKLTADERKILDFAKKFQDCRTEILCYIGKDESSVKDCVFGWDLLRRSMYEFLTIQEDFAQIFGEECVRFEIIK